MKPFETYNGCAVGELIYDGLQLSIKELPVERGKADFKRLTEPREICMSK